MKTFPDFTWEWIIKSCEQFCSELQRFVESDSEGWPETQKGYFQSAQGLIAIVPKLREHPQLETLVPMKSLLGLRWFPAEGCEVTLFCEESMVKYSITVTNGSGEIKEEKIVAFNEVADEIYAQITKLGEK